MEYFFLKSSYAGIMFYYSEVCWRGYTLKASLIPKIKKGAYIRRYSHELHHSQTPNLVDMKKPSRARDTKTQLWVLIWVPFSALVSLAGWFVICVVRSLQYTGLSEDGATSNPLLHHDFRRTKNQNCNLARCHFQEPHPNILWFILYILQYNIL